MCSTTVSFVIFVACVFVAATAISAAAVAVVMVAVVSAVVLLLFYKFMLTVKEEGVCDSCCLC